MILTVLIHLFLPLLLLAQDCTVEPVALSIAPTLSGVEDGLTDFATFQTVAFTGYWNFISCPIAVITATNVVYLDGFEYANIESWSLTYEPNPVTAVFDVGPVTLDLASGTHTAIVTYTFDASEEVGLPVTGVITTAFTLGPATPTSNGSAGSEEHEGLSKAAIGGIAGGIVAAFIVAIAVAAALIRYRWKGHWRKPRDSFLLEDIKLDKRTSVGKTAAGGDEFGIAE